jgi:hypothetical protein
MAEVLHLHGHMPGKPSCSQVGRLLTLKTT